MDKVLTYKEFMALALENYRNGGDGVYECWDELSFRYYVEEFGPMTKSKAMALFRTYDEVGKDWEGM